MLNTIHYSGTLAVVSCWCGIRHGVPSELRDLQIRQRDSGEVMVDCFCPIGHKHYPAGEPKYKQLERELEQERNKTTRERAAHDQTRSELRHTERRRRAAKGQLTKTKNRISKGACPCCNRTFQNLARHMDSQHPEYTATEAD